MYYFFFFFLKDVFHRLFLFQTLKDGFDLSVHNLPVFIIKFLHYLKQKFHRLNSLQISELVSFCHLHSYFIRILRGILVHAFPGERIQCWKNLREANDSRDALAKDLYSRLFGWIVGQVNRNMWANTNNQKR